MNPFAIILNLDKYIGLFIQNYGYLTYLILFVIIFLETGLVITPFLPGDSLLFVSGTFAAHGSMNVFVLFLVFALAAILGDNLNYWMGNYFGENVFAKSRFFHKDYLDKTERFYKNHGNKTIVLARFLPIIRTFAPFLAGIAKMDYNIFLFYNILGALIWVSIFLSAGYFFGAIPVVYNNLNFIVLVIIFSSLIPPIIEYLRNKNLKRNN